MKKCEFKIEHNEEIDITSVKFGRNGKIFYNNWENFTDKYAEQLQDIGLCEFMEGIMEFDDAVSSVEELEEKLIEMGFIKNNYL